MESNFKKEYSYDLKASSTVQINKKTQDLVQGTKYGQGEVEGHFYFDDVRIGNDEDNQIFIKQQEFGNIEETKEIFTGDNFEAIVGLGYPKMSDKGVRPLFDTMI